MNKEFYLLEEGETPQQAIASHTRGGFSSVDQAILAAETEITNGAEYAVIDGKWKVFYCTVSPPWLFAEKYRDSK
jgi:hypothetical protein